MGLRATTQHQLRSKAATSSAREWHNEAKICIYFMDVSVVYKLKFGVYVCVGRGCDSASFCGWRTLPRV